MNFTHSLTKTKNQKKKKKEKKKKKKKKINDKYTGKQNIIKS